MEPALAAFGFVIGSALLKWLMDSVRGMKDGKVKRLLLYGERGGATPNGWGSAAYQLGKLIGLGWSLCKQGGKRVLSSP